MKYHIELTKSELEQIIWELGQGMSGEDSSYDRRLARTKNKLEEILR